MGDGLLGDNETEVPIGGILFDKVDIARDIVLTEALVVVTHATGHGGNGLGGCMKNIGIIL